MIMTGEKKAVREKEAAAMENVKKIVAKLGTGWEVKWDWEALGAAIPDRRMEMGTLYYEQFTKGLLEEVEKMDAEVLEALNDAVGANKVITYSASKDGDFSSGGGSYRLEGLKDGVKITQNAAWPTYNYPQGSYTITEYVLKNC